MAPASADLYITQKEAATILRCTERTVRTMIARGDLRAYRVGPKFIRLRRDEIEKSLTPIGAGAA